MPRQNVADRMPPPDKARPMASFRMSFFARSAGSGCSGGKAANCATVLGESSSWRVLRQMRRRRMASCSATLIACGVTSVFAALEPGVTLSANLSCSWLPLGSASTLPLPSVLALALAFALALSSALASVSVVILTSTCCWMPAGNVSPRFAPPPSGLSGMSAKRPNSASFFRTSRNWGRSSCNSVRNWRRTCSSRNRSTGLPSLSLRSLSSVIQPCQRAV